MIHFPVNRDLFKQLSNRLFHENDGVLYPIKDRSDQFFYKDSEKLIRNHQKKFLSSQKKSKKMNSIDEKIKAELRKLKNLLRAEKAHEKYKFSKIDKIFGWIRFEDDPSTFYRFEVSNDNYEILEDRKQQVEASQKEFQLKTRNEFVNHPDSAKEENLEKYLNELPNASTFSMLNMSEHQKLSLKCFIIGTNNNIVNPKQMFNYLHNLQDSSILSQTNNESENTQAMKRNELKEQMGNSITLSTADVNPLLLQQYLIGPIQVPKFLIKEELDEDKVRELQVYYQNWGLENGDFFDGYLFRNEFGDPYNGHPSKFILLL
jgi:hypothetical protein